MRGIKTVLLAGAIAAWAGGVDAQTTLRIGLNEDPDMLDPTLARSFVGRIVFETETAEVLQAMAAADHGVAWLPESVAKRAPPGVLERIDSGEWSTTLGIVAYRDKHTGTAAMERLWALLSSGKF